MRFSVAVLALLVILVQSVNARADDGFRCKGDRLVNEGDRMFEVRALCGEPDGVFHRVERHGGQIDEWTYDLGPTTFTRTVVFRNGRVADIVAGSYGRKTR
jgi:hypothetical protein